MCTSSALSDVGKKRQINQDSFLCREDLGLFIVADGMGGHDDGKQASEMACHIICEQCLLGHDVETAINIAHQNIIHQSNINHSLKGMGTTLVVLQKIGEKFLLSWVGDSRAYLFERNNLTCLTKDHSIVQELIDRKLITAKEARVHPKRNLLTQSVGLSNHESLKIDYAIIHLDADAEILLCSDGLSTELDDCDIESILQQNNNQEKRVKALVDKANENGGKDNITAMLIAS